MAARGRRRPAGAAFLYGLSAAILASAGLSFGLWQSRWLALLILALLQLKVVQRALTRSVGGEAS